jgi:heme-degrading monooxygenase HmoA
LIVIARIWKGWTRGSDTNEYVRYLLETGIKEYKATAGNRGAFILHRPRGGRTEFVMLSFWDSLDSVRTFAGDSTEQAIFYPEDDRFLVERETTVTHFEVVAGDRDDGTRPVGGSNESTHSTR